MSPVLRGGIAAALLAAVGLGYWSLSTDEAMRPEASAVRDSGDAPRREPASSAAPQAGAAPEPQEADAQMRDAQAADAPAPGAAAPEATEATAQVDPTRATAQEPAGAPVGSGPDGEEAAQADQVKLPEFDLVRVEPDGSAVIAGTAAPGDEIRLLLDEDSLVQTTADRSGAFVAITRIPAGAAPRVLSLIARGDTGERRSQSSVIVAPLLMAETAPGASPAPAGHAGGQAPAGGPAAPDAQGEAGPATALATAGLASGEPAPDQLAALVPDSPPRPETDPAPALRTPGAPEADLADATVEATRPEAVAGGAEPVAGTAPQTEPVALAEGPEPVAPQAPAAPTVEKIVADAAPDAAPQSPQPGAAMVTAGPSSAEATVMADSGGAPAEVRNDAVVTTRAAPSATQRAAAGVATPADPGASTAAPVGAPQVLVASSKGLRVLQPAEDAKAVPLRVETIGYSKEGVTLAGRGDGGPSNLRIYLDNAPVGEAALAEDGSWATELEGVQPGKYTLRVDQIEEDGAVSSRFETPFLRETEEALARNAPVQTDRERVAISVITVQPGYSLWLIATDRYGDGMAYHKVLAANADQIRDPDLIYPGQVFDLPPE